MRITEILSFFIFLYILSKKKFVLMNEFKPSSYYSEPNELTKNNQIHELLCQYEKNNLTVFCKFYSNGMFYIYEEPMMCFPKTFKFHLYPEYFKLSCLNHLTKNEIIKTISIDNIIKKSNINLRALEENRIQNCEILNPSDPTKCSKCVESNFLDYSEKECVKRCDENYVADVSNGKCINCKISNKYNLEGTCVETKPQGYYIKNDTTYLIKPCYDTCATCSSGGDYDNHLCDSCNGTYYFLDKQCLLSCPEHLTKYKNKCEECNKINSKYKFIYKGECLETQKSNTYIYDSSTGLLKDCHSNCQKCSKGPTIINNNCDECINTLYLDDEFNCVTNCVGEFGRYGKKCVKCKSLSTPMYLVDNECVSSCSGDTEPDDSTMTCLDKTKCLYQCLNEGTCDKQKDECICKDSTGTYCQFKDNTLRKEEENNIKIVSGSDFISSIETNTFYVDYYNPPKDEVFNRNNYLYTWNVSSLLVESTTTGFNEPILKISKNSFKPNTTYTIYVTLKSKENFSEVAQSELAITVLPLNNLNFEISYTLDSLEPIPISYETKMNLSVTNKNEKEGNSREYRYKFYYENIYGDKIPLSSANSRSPYLNTYVPITSTIFVEIEDAYQQKTYFQKSTEIKKGNVFTSLMSTINSAIWDYDRANRVYNLLVENKDNDKFFCSISVSELGNYATVTNIHLNNSLHKNPTLPASAFLQGVSIILTGLSNCNKNSNLRLLEENNNSNDLDKRYETIANIIFETIDKVLEIAEEETQNEDTITSIYRNLQIIIDQSIESENLSLYNRIKTYLNKMNNYLMSKALRGEKILLICKSFSSLIIIPTKERKFISISEKDITQDRTDCVLSITLDELSSDEDCNNSDIFCIDVKNYQLLNQVTSLIHGDNDASILDLNFLFLIYHNSSIIYDNNNNKYTPFSSYSVNFEIWDNNSNSQLTNSNHLSYKVSLPSNFQDGEAIDNKMCVPISNIKNQDSFCKTYVDNENKVFQCVCNSTGEIAVIEDVELAAYYKKIQYPIKEVQVLNTFSLSFYLMTILLFSAFGIYFLISDYREDQNKLNLQKKGDEVRLRYQFESVRSLKERGTFSFSIFILLHSFSFFKVFNSYYYSIPKYVRFYIELLSLIIGIFCSLLPYYYLPFDYKTDIINKRDIEKKDIIIDELPVRAIDVFLGFCFGISGYVIGWIISIILMNLCGYYKIVSDNWYEKRNDIEEFVKFFLALRSFSKKKEFKRVKIKLLAIGVFLKIKKELSIQKEKESIPDIDYSVQSLSHFSTKLSSRGMISSKKNKQNTNLKAFLTKEMKLYIERTVDVEYPGIPDIKLYDYRKVKRQNIQKGLYTPLLNDYSRSQLNKKIKNDKIPEKTGQFLNPLKSGQYEIVHTENYSFFNFVPNTLEKRTNFVEICYRIKALTLSFFVFCCLAGIYYLGLLIFDDIYQVYGNYVVKVWFYPLIITVSVIGILISFIWNSFVVYMVNNHYKERHEKGCYSFLFSFFIPKYVIYMTKIRRLVARYNNLYEIHYVEEKKKKKVSRRESRMSKDENKKRKNEPMIKKKNTMDSKKKSKKPKRETFNVELKNFD